MGKIKQKYKHFFDLLNRIEKETIGKHGNFQIIDKGVFEKQLGLDTFESQTPEKQIEILQEVQKQMMLERLQKCLKLSFASMEQVKFMTQSMEDSYNSGNVFAYQIIMRSLMEYIGDSIEVIGKIPSILEANNTFIHQILDKKATVVYDFTEFDNMLDHYFFADAEDKKSKNKAAFLKAKRTIDYISNLGFASDIAIKQAKDLYYELCNITHPSKESVDLINLSLSPLIDQQKYISYFEDRFLALEFEPIEQVFNPAIAIFRQVNMFDNKDKYGFKHNSVDDYFNDFIIGSQRNTRHKI